jgi:hypothetical protein
MTIGIPVRVSKHTTSFKHSSRRRSLKLRRNHSTVDSSVQLMPCAPDDAQASAASPSPRTLVHCRYKWPLAHLVWQTEFRKTVKHKLNSLTERARAQWAPQRPHALQFTEDVERPMSSSLSRCQLTPLRLTTQLKSSRERRPPRDADLIPIPISAATLTCEPARF